MDDRQRAAAEELRQRREELHQRREDTERRSKEAAANAEYHGSRAEQINDRMLRRGIEGRSGFLEQARDRKRLSGENKQAKKAREEKETAQRELNSVYHDEIRLKVDETKHGQRNFAAECREEAAAEHARIEEQYPAYAQGSGIGHKIEDPDEMHKVEVYARDREQIRQREQEFVDEQTARGVEEHVAQKQASRQTLHDYGLYSHIYGERAEDREDRNDQDGSESRRQDIARRTGVEIEDREPGDDQDRGDDRDEGLGY